MDIYLEYRWGNPESCRRVGAVIAGISQVEMFTRFGEHNLVRLDIVGVAYSNTMHIELEIIIYKTTLDLSEYMVPFARTNYDVGAYVDGYANTSFEDVRNNWKKILIT